MKKSLLILTILALIVLVSGCINSAYTLTEKDSSSINSTISSYLSDVDINSTKNATTVGSVMNMASPSSMKIINLTAVSNNEAKAVISRTVQSYKITSANKNNIDTTTTEGTTEVKKTGTEIHYGISPLEKYEQTWEFILKKNNETWKVVSANMTLSNIIK